MIHLLSASYWKNKLKAREQELRNHYAQQEESLVKDMERQLLQLKEKLAEGQAEVQKAISDVEIKKRDVQDIERRLVDREKELASVNHELKEQIRIIEAKSKPDQIWVTAFTTAFSKSWDMMLPLMRQGLDKVKEEIREQEIEASIPRINTVVQEKLRELKNFKLLEVSQVEAKKREFEMRLTRTADQEDQKKLNNFIQVLNWVLEQRNGN